MKKSISCALFILTFLVFAAFSILSAQPVGALSSFGITAPPFNHQKSDSLQPRVDSLFAAYDTTGSPGAVVGAMRGGEVIFAKGYGMADVTHNIPITTDTRFNIASISKQFTGFAFALLEQRGKLSLDDPARKYLPELPKFDETVTLRHMLTHTSGYREAYGTLALRGLLASRDYLSREEALEVIRRQPALEFSPDSDYRYNSTAYVVLALILERVTDEPFPVWMNKHVFDPLDMNDTVIEDEVGQIIPGAATSYYYDEEDSSYTTAFSNRAIFGSAEIYTTVGDLAKWMQNFHTAGVGGTEVQNQLRERFVLANGDTTHYGLGIGIDRERGLARVHHSGSHAGYGSKLNYYPGLNAGVVVMSNHDDLNAGSKARKVARIFFGEHMDLRKEREKEQYAEVDSALIARYEGRYKTESGEVISLERRNNSLVLSRSRDIQFTLHPKSDTKFQTSNQSVQVTFQVAADSQQIKKATLADSVETTLTRIPSFDPTPSELKEYAGRYLSPELQAIYTITVRDSQLVAKHRILGTLALAPEAHAIHPGTFETENGSIHPTLQFERNKMGTITGFYASLWRTERVWFQRRD